jgi:hypothetical protein
MLSNILFILLGAGLVSVGFLGAALAERLRSSRETARCAGCGRDQDANAARNLLHRRDLSRGPVPPIAAVEPAAVLRQVTVTTRTPRARTEPKVTPGDEGGEDVVAALVAAGYKKSIAAEATWACTTAERVTIEGWTAVALRRLVSAL